jgi:hypothetical protein
MVALAITPAGFNPWAARRSTSYGDGIYWHLSVPPTGKVFQLAGACGWCWCGFLEKRAALTITGGRTVNLWVDLEV